MKKILLIGFCAALLLVGFGYVKREPLMLSYLASQVPDVAFEDHRAALAAHIQYRAPQQAGQGPYPAMVLFHGCAGVRQEFMNQWADVASAAGYMAVIVDSLTLRGIDRERALQTVCQGKELIGQERAGDIAVALDLIKARTDIDADRIHLAGWSHGAWAIMDYLTMDMTHARPAQLGKSAPPKHQPAGVILFYPYCGEGARTRFAGWDGAFPTLTFIAGMDSVVNADDCLSVFNKLEKQGENIALHYYEDADHVFDDAAYKPEFAHYYHAEHARDATEKVAAYLQQHRR